MVLCSDGNGVDVYNHNNCNQNIAIDAQESFLFAYSHHGNIICPGIYCVAGMSVNV